MNKLLTTSEVCIILGIKSRATIYTYIATGRLKAHRLGNGQKRHWRIYQNDLEAFIREGKSEASI